jgi:hypothetical protein
MSLKIRMVKDSLALLDQAQHDQTGSEANLRLASLEARLKSMTDLFGNYEGIGQMLAELSILQNTVKSIVVQKIPEIV